jgi:hypothetical protein
VTLAPWRKVVANGKLTGSKRWISRTQTLECGHKIRITGSERALHADSVLKRRCKECGEAAQQQEDT